MPQWEVIFQEPGTRDTYKGEPGRLHIPTPRNDDELLKALKFILERHRPIRITINATEQPAVK